MSFAPDLAELHGDQWTQPFWDAAREHQLVIPLCSSCNEGRLPATQYCPHCGAEGTEWIPVSGNAVIHSATICRQAFHPALKDHVPYVLATVTPVEYPAIRLVTNIITSDVESVQIGDAVNVVWDDVDENTTIPRFTPSAE